MLPKPIILNHWESDLFESLKHVVHQFLLPKEEMFPLPKVIHPEIFNLVTYDTNKCQKYGIWSYKILTLIDLVYHFLPTNPQVMNRIGYGKGSLNIVLLLLNSMLLCKNFMLIPRLEHKAREKRISKLTRRDSGDNSPNEAQARRNRNFPE